MSTFFRRLRSSVRLPAAGTLHAVVVVGVIALGTIGMTASCGSTGADSAFGDGTQSSGAGASGGAGFGSSGGDGGSSGRPGDGTLETCDGIDNDGNGIIDDIDVGKDGICDCLRIATLGAPGTHGSGNVFSSWLNSRTKEGAASLGNKALDRALLDGYQVIVAQDLSKLGRPLDPSEVTALAEWVQRGGGLLTLIGYADASEVQNVNRLLASFEMNYGTQPILQKQGGSTVPITGWTTHPVTQGVTRVGVDNGYPVQGKGTTLATESGFNLLNAQEVGAGHVLVWGDEWITYDSEWNDHPEYQVALFWVNMVKWLTPAKECQVPVPPNVK